MDNEVVVVGHVKNIEITRDDTDVRVIRTVKRKIENPELIELEDEKEVVFIRHIKRRHLMEIVRSSNQAFRNKSKAYEEKIREQKGINVNVKETRRFINTLSIKENVKEQIRDILLNQNEDGLEKKAEDIDDSSEPSLGYQGFGV